MMEEIEVLILGAGLAGLSTSFHLGHDRCVIVESKAHAFGHISSYQMGGFTWDEGPHVSFTKHPYIQKLFEQSVGGEYLEFPVKTTNFYQGSKVDHPAQSNLYQVPEALRKQCIDDFLASRKAGSNETKPHNYAEWLYRAFGRTFADTFPRAYTKKYWTTEPENLTVDWVGGRVFFPAIDHVVNGASGPLAEQTHYIKKIRYPKYGGYQSYGEILAKGADIRLNSKVSAINLETRVVTTESGQSFRYQQLVNTIPLPIFVNLCQQSSPAAKAAAEQLCCSESLLVNVTIDHPTAHPEHWFYVYDEDLLSTRINCTEQLSPNNAPTGSSGIQVEVYASKYRPFPNTFDAIGAQVVEELKQLGFIDISRSKVGPRHHVQYVPFANIVFDHQREGSLEIIYSELEDYELIREQDALEPTTDWEQSTAEAVPKSYPGAIHLAGRFGQWKYFWSDDCVMRGKQLKSRIN